MIYKGDYVKKIRVLMVGNHPSVKGGISSVISQLMSYEWAKNNIEMEFIPTYIEANCLLKIAYFFVAYLKVLKFIQKSRPDVVHIHMSYKGSFFRKYQIHKLCKKYGIPDIIHLHGSEFKKWFDGSSQKGKIKSLLRECNKVIVLGEKWNKIILGIEPNTKTFVISNTVHIPSDTTHYNLPFKVLFMGVLIKRKGIFDLIETINHLKKINKLDGMKFILAGAGAEEIELKRKCKEYKLDNYIEFMGWVSGKKKDDLYMNCQMAILPSYNEGLPISILEALSYGMPLIATDVGDISSAVKNGINGYLFQPGDVIEMADAIYKVSSNRKLYDTLSDASRKIAEEKFSDKEYFINMANLYIELADN